MTKVGKEEYRSLKKANIHFCVKLLFYAPRLWLMLYCYFMIFFLLSVSLLGGKAGVGGGWVGIQDAISS